MIISYIFVIIILPHHQKLLGKSETDKYEVRIFQAKKKLKNKKFSRKEYMEINQDISTATASNDLRKAVKEEKLQKIGRANQMKYCFNKIS